jgi:hypothetical protein
MSGLSPMGHCLWVILVDKLYYPCSLGRAETQMHGTGLFALGISKSLLEHKVTTYSEK